jgi:hypothetical protein
MAQRPVLQFKITLQGIKPGIWRRIQLSDLCSFWDLHVAIQDAMGWLDCHLHQFTVRDLECGEPLFLGIPDDEGFDDDMTLPGWEHKVAPYLQLKTNHKIRYLYDFGDSWEHLVVFEGVQAKVLNKYPVCIVGQGACPPEDVGGIPGYENFLEAISDPSHEEHDALLEWVGGSFNPYLFSLIEVSFSNPRKRLKEALGK